MIIVLLIVIITKVIFHEPEPNHSTTNIGTKTKYENTNK